MNDSSSDATEYYVHEIETPPSIPEVYDGETVYPFPEEWSTVKLPANPKPEPEARPFVIPHQDLWQPCGQIPHQFPPYLPHNYGVTNIHSSAVSLALDRFTSIVGKILFKIKRLF